MNEKTHLMNIRLPNSHYEAGRNDLIKKSPVMRKKLVVR